MVLKQAWWLWNSLTPLKRAWQFCNLLKLSRQLWPAPTILKLSMLYTLFPWVPIFMVSFVITLPTKHWSCAHAHQFPCSGHTLSTIFSNLRVQAMQHSLRLSQRENLPIYMYSGFSDILQLLYIMRRAHAQILNVELWRPARVGGKLPMMTTYDGEWCGRERPWGIHTLS